MQEPSSKALGNFQFSLLFLSRAKATTDQRNTSEFADRFPSIPAFGVMGEVVSSAMSIVLLLLLVSALYAMEYFRRRGEAFAARLVPAERTPERQAEFAKFPVQRESPAAIERRHRERRSSERRHAA